MLLNNGNRTLSHTHTHTHTHTQRQLQKTFRLPVTQIIFAVVCILTYFEPNEMLS